LRAFRKFEVSLCSAAAMPVKFCFDWRLEFHDFENEKSGAVDCRSPPFVTACQNFSYTWFIHILGNVHNGDFELSMKPIGRVPPAMVVAVNCKMESGLKSLKMRCSNALRELFTPELQFANFFLGRTCDEPLEMNFQLSMASSNFRHTQFAQLLAPRPAKNGPPQKKSRLAAPDGDRDFAIRAFDGKSIKVHREFLSTWSAYCKTMLESNGKENYLVVPYKVEAIKAIVDYMYTAELKLGNEKWPLVIFEHLLQMMEQWQLDDDDPERTLHNTIEQSLCQRVAVFSRQPEDFKARLLLIQGWRLAAVHDLSILVNVCVSTLSVDADIQELVLLPSSSSSNEEEDANAVKLTTENAQLHALLHDAGMTRNLGMEILTNLARRSRCRMME